MPRIREYKEAYDCSDFCSEVRSQMGRFDITQGEFARRSDIPEATFCKRMKDPLKFSVSELRRIVKQGRLDLFVVLRFIGYEDKEIRAAIDKWVKLHRS